jgi:hypothetical protein
MLASENRYSSYGSAKVLNYGKITVKIDQFEWWSIKLARPTIRPYVFWV